MDEVLEKMLNQVQHDRGVQHEKTPVTLNVIQGLHKRLSDFEQKKSPYTITGFSTMDKLSKLLLILV